MLNLLDPCAKRMSWAFFPGRRKNDVSDTFVHVAVRVVLQAGLEMDVVLDNDDVGACGGCCLLPNEPSLFGVEP